MAVEIVKSVCPKDCFDTCGMLTHVADGKVVRVEGDPDHPITKGFLCGQVQHFEEFVNHPDRLLFPLMRDSKSEPFRRVGWDEALTAIADRFGDIIAAEGGQAILPYSYFGHMGLVSGGFAERLWNRMNTSRVGLEICALAGAEAFIRVFGLLRGCESYHLDKTQCHVIWGKNPIATSVHSHAMTKNIHPTIVIDPYRSDSALSADLYLQPKPATDSMLAMAVMRILIEREQIDKRFVAEHTTGFEPLHDKVMSISLEEAAKITAVPASQITEFAELYAANRPALISMGAGLQRNLNGGEMVSAICMLAAVAGQVGVAGGGVVYANHDWRMNDISHGELRSDGPQLHSMLKLGQSLTANDDIKALYVYNSNAAATTPNQSLVWRGMAREDLFTVVHDSFMTDTTERANLVLPACTYAEHADLHRSHWHEYAQINNPAIPPLGESRSNSSVFREIARRMGYTEECLFETDEEVIHDLLKGTNLDYEELKRGPVLCEDAHRTSFDDGRFPTASGKLELMVPTYSPIESSSRHGYRFTTPKSRHLQSSQAFNLPRKFAAVREPSVFVHPIDAANEGIEDGEQVNLWNERGEVALIARLSERVQPGLLVSYMIRWGANANATTPDEPADYGGNSTFHSNFVSISRRA
ncbi:MAG: molybdopterin-dependent oxidoreductase [Alphaproteobacteria bacterium]|nr:molybdopterin-dependent oxidoreductase [Alphaproteobacteria bacterium]